ncbi:MAG TPA: glycosyltransferase family 2 protein [Chthoniobacterales bacterium]
MNLLVLMAGSHPSFEQTGHVFPRNLVQINDRPVLQHVMENLLPLQSLGAKICALVSREEDRRFHTSRVLRLLNPEIAAQLVEGTTAGALCTALLAIGHIDREEPLIISNGDILMDCDLREAIRDFQERGLDGGAVVFRDIHPRWSFIKLDEAGFAIEAAEKRPISHHATTGFYYYRRGGDFLEAAFRSLLKDAHVEGSFYICPVFNEMILDQKRVGVWPIERSRYHTLKTAEDVRAYEERLTGVR